MCALCCLALFWVDDSRPLLKVDGHVEAAGHLGVARQPAARSAATCGQLLRSRIGILALMICLLPIGSGAAQNLWSPIAGEWHASADVVAFVTGAMSGLISAVGCLVGGWLCDRMDRKTAYCLFGFLLAAAAVGMALCPRTSDQYIFWTSAYAFVVGLCYAAYCAVVLEAIGGTAAATKFSFLSARVQHAHHGDDLRRRRGQYPLGYERDAVDGRLVRRRRHRGVRAGGGRHAAQAGDAGRRGGA